MRKRTGTRSLWGAGVLTGVLLLGACGDPGAGDAAPADLPEASTPATPPEPSATPRERAARDAPDKSSRAPKVLYLGDSLAMENQVVLGQQLKSRLGARYRSAPYSGTTLCDYLDGTGEDSLVPDKDKAAALVRAQRPDYVVLQFWGNAWGYTPCMKGITYDKRRAEYLDRYAADARRLAAQIRGAGGGRARVVWVLQGPDPITPDRVRRVNAIYQAQARATGGLVADAGRTVAPGADRYTWVEKLPCTAYERAHPEYCTEPGAGLTALHREKDDYLHFCLAPTTAKSRPCPVRSPGIRRMAEAVTSRVASDLR
ncbi:SGNH/GDSL hydrolase family protein [Streptomyces venezuelae]|uniref:SGNH/GDSL hydrolase family protein n=1 Tax=Streptomyces venezuelae TaxID=54571 RepID=UPI00167FF24D|nr:SGNH/GDSL hydrolase family protein [Streptomyces venezuelae]